MPEERAWLRAHPLRVLKMAGVVNRGPRVDRLTFGTRRRLGENLANVPALGGETFGAIGVRRIVAQQIAVLFEIRTTAGGVGDDVVDVGIFEGVNGLPSEFKGARFFASVN